MRFPASRLSKQGRDRRGRDDSLRQLLEAREALGARDANEACGIALQNPVQGEGPASEAGARRGDHRGGVRGRPRIQRDDKAGAREDGPLPRAAWEAPQRKAVRDQDGRVEEADARRHAHQEAHARAEDQSVSLPLRARGRQAERNLSTNKALLVTRPDSDTIEEAEALAVAAGYEPVGLLTQAYLHHAKYGVGSGKAEELAVAVKEKGADLVIFDSALRASQAYALAKLCKVEVKDRE